MTERTIGQLVVDVQRDVSELVRYEVALAKAELRDDAKQAGLGAGLFGGAGYFAVVASILLFVAAAYGLHEGAGWPRWLSFLAVAVVLLLLAALMALVGRGRVRKVRPPERTIATTKGTIAAVKGKRS
ncbi:MAG: phage holin family protein [Actinomycetes bacterium]